MSILDFRLPIAITSFNRPQYLQQCIKSLESQEDLENVEFILVQDGDRNIRSHRKRARVKDILQCIEIFEQSSLPNKHMILPKRRRIPYFENLGVALNHQRAYDYCFKEHDYPAFVLSEDDLVYNPDWLRVTKVLIRQFMHDERVAVVQTSCVKNHAPSFEDRKTNYDVLLVGNPDWRGYAIFRRAWEKMEPDFRKYLEFVQQFDYQKRNNKKIREWWITQGKNEPRTSQDRAKEHAVLDNEMLILYTYANRALYTGIHGVHCNPASFERNKYAKMKNERIPGDKKLDKFREITKDEIKRYFLKVRENGF